MWRILPLLLVCVQCSTPYQQASRSVGRHGYSDQYLGDDTYLITVRLNAFTDKATAFEYFHRRAAQIRRAKRYDRYEVLELLDPDESAVTWIGDKPQVWRFPRIQGRVKFFHSQVAAKKQSAPSTEPAVPTWSSGTAWVSAGGWVVTNEHVVDGRDEITLLRTDGRKLQASVAVRDRANDLALLRVGDPSDLPDAIPLAERALPIGASVFTIGYPLPDLMGLEPKLTAGTVTSASGWRDDPRTYQISVPVHGGNSGGPLINMNGEAAGVVTSKLDLLFAIATGELPQNIGYAIKAPYLALLVSSAPSSSGTAQRQLPATAGTLEEVAARVQNSVLLVLGRGIADGPIVPDTPVTAAVEAQSLADELQTLTHGLAEYTSYRVADLDSTRAFIMAHLFREEPTANSLFRWGAVLAPRGSPRSGGTFYVLKLVGPSGTLTENVTIDSQGQVIERRLD